MSSLLIANCPRCGAKHITFDLWASIFTRMNQSDEAECEAFCICRYCKKSTVFVLSSNGLEGENCIRNNLGNIGNSVNHMVYIKEFISLKDTSTIKPPEHLPAEIQAVFTEGATCLSVGCYNAAGTMFRLCVDLATKAMLPESDDYGLNDHIRRTLGLRLLWLFNNNYLPIEMRELSSCIKEDGNDGAHVGSLNKIDADDLLDFTTALLERMYTEPERIRQADERRKERRSAQQNPST